jgi:archaea-specific DNA-binding protein
MTLEQQKSDNPREEGLKDNTIFIGGKPLVNYIRGVITQFTKWNSSEVIIKSRGKFISKAVDVAEVAKRSLEDKKINIKDIKIASESFESEGKRTNISTMDIVLAIE